MSYQQIQRLKIERMRLCVQIGNHRLLAAIKKKTHSYDCVIAGLLRKIDDVDRRLEGFGVRHESF